MNGAKLWTVSFGKGDPLFFIAGGPGGSHYGLRSFDTLSSQYTLVYFDGLGRGKSDTAKKVSEYTLDRDIEDLEGLRKAMGYETINILGHSYGGVVAQGYAVKYPQHVKHLILANTFHSFVMWQENDDNSNHEIKENYPEVWDTLMKIKRARLYLLLDYFARCDFMEENCLMDFVCIQSTEFYLVAEENLIPILLIQNYIIKWLGKMVILLLVAILAILIIAKN